jgi:acetolactate decarboxylase
MKSRDMQASLIALIIVLIGIIGYLILFPTITSAGIPPEKAFGAHDTLYQVSTINALLQSVYEGMVPISEVRHHGDFAIGTTDDLEGEVIGVDGEYYVIRTDGMAYPLDDTTTTPFISATFFEPDFIIPVNDTADIRRFEKELESGLPSANMVYAIRIDATFDYIKTRSVPKQTRPYPKLADVVAKQSVFEFYNTTGTIVGFWSPEFLSGLNVPGYHIHFINGDRTAGGHVLGLQMTDGEIAVDITPNLAIVLPTQGDFCRVNLTEDLSSALEYVEKN